MISFPPRAPDAIRTYGLDWSGTLATGDTLASVAWTVPAGLTLVSQGVNSSAVAEGRYSYAAGTLAMVRLSGGLAGADYTLTCAVVTAQGDRDSRTVRLPCRAL